MSTGWMAEMKALRYNPTDINLSLKNSSTGVWFWGTDSRTSEEKGFVILVDSK